MTAPRAVAGLAAGRRRRRRSRHRAGPRACRTTRSRHRATSPARSSTPAAATRRTTTGWTAQGIDLTGKIALVRYSVPYSYRGFKALTAQQRGLAGILIYSDPADDGYRQGEDVSGGPVGTGEPHPARRHPLRLPRARRSADAGLGVGARREAHRGGRRGLDSEDHQRADVVPGRAGDPRGARRAGGAADVARARCRSRIAPAAAARRCAWWCASTAACGRSRRSSGRIRGRSVPGPGDHPRQPPRRVGVRGRRSVERIRSADGARAQPRRAWCASGFRPKRTIVLASWDAEEFTLTSSTEWGEQYAEELRQPGGRLHQRGQRGVGPLFTAVGGAVAEPAGVGSRARRARSGIAASRSQQATARAANAERGALPNAQGHGLVNNRLGSGSDYTVFLNFLGIPVIDMSFDGPYGVYHSIYDNHQWVSRIGDPGFRYHTAMTKLWGLMALRLANADVLPFDYAGLRGAAEGVRDRSREAVDRGAAAGDGRGRARRRLSGRCTRRSDASHGRLDGPRRAGAGVRRGHHRSRATR